MLKFALSLSQILAHGLGSITKTVLTGPDNETWAPGRIMGFGVFIVGQCMVIRAAQSILKMGPSVTDWVAFFTGAANFEALNCATAIGLVLGMAPADPGGKWWGKEASPPSAVSPRQ